MKAMATAPGDRYQSARDIAAEVDRWLADEPVVASPESFVERAARYARRNYRWLGPLAAAVVLVAVVAAVAAATVSKARSRELAATQLAKRQSDRAVARSLEARDTVDEWLTGFTEASTYYPGLDGFRRRMLESAAERYESWLLAGGKDPSLQLEAAWTRLRLGDVNRHLLETDEAMKSYLAAAEGFRQLADRPGATSGARSGLARAYGKLALAYTDAGDAKQAERHHQLALGAIVAALDVEQEPAQKADLELTLSDIETNRAAALAARGDLKQAESAFDGIVRRLERLSKLSPAQNPHQIETRTSLATAMLGWGQVIAMLGDSARARDLYRRAADDLAALSQLAEDQPSYVKAVASANLFLAIAEGQLGNYASEATAYRQNIAAYEQLNEEFPSNPSFQEEQARTEIDLGQTLLRQGEAASAQQTLDAAVERLEQLRQRDPTFPPYQEAYGLARVLLGQSAAMLGQNADAVEHARAAVEQFLLLAGAFPDVPQYHVRAASSLSHLAQLRFLDGRADEALADFQQAAERLDQVVAAYPSDPSARYASAVVASRWGEVMAAADDSAGAERQADVADEQWRQLLDLSKDAEYLAAAAWHDAAFPLVERRQPARAVERATAALKQAPQNGFYRTLVALAELRTGKARACLGELDRAEEQNADEFSTTLAELIRALAHRELDQGSASAAAYQAAVQRMESKPLAAWELLTLRREYDRSTKDVPPTP
jgi:tetratricopeptide (TPR) repeat protein